MKKENVTNKAFHFPIPSAPDGVVWLETNGEISKLKREWLPDGVCEPDPSPLVPAFQRDCSFCHGQIISAANLVSPFVKQP